MVGTGPTNKLGRIPHGTKINLISPKKEKLPVRRKVTMEDAASPAKSGDKQESPPGAEIDLLLGLMAGGDEAPTLLGEGEEEQGEAQTPGSGKVAAEEEKEKTSSSKKAKKTPPSAKIAGKTKTDRSAAASSPTATTEEASGKDEEEEVQSG